MPTTDWANLHRSADARRKDASPEAAPVETLADLMKHTRSQLEVLAQLAGVTDAGSMPNKRAIATAIVAAGGPNRAIGRLLDAAVDAEAKAIEDAEAKAKRNADRFAYLTEG